MDNNFLKNKKFIIATHSRLAIGPSEELEKYLKTGSKELVYIAHPFYYCDNPRTFVNIYRDGIQVKKIYAPLIKGHEIIHFIKDVILNFFYILSLRSKFNIFIGINNLNAFCGVILKKLKIVDMVIFYTIDYVPRRFKSKLLSSIYHFIDRYCCHHCNYVWNLSWKMEDARYKNGISRIESAPQIVVPNGSNFRNIERLSFERINRFDIVFVGHLTKNQGIELLIRAFPEISSEIPQARLLIIGNGPLSKELKEQSDSLGLRDKVIFEGFLKDHTELERLLAKSAVGVAPYEPDKDSFAYFCDPGKVKVYLAAGLPVVITKVPPVAEDLERERAGISVDYSEGQLSEAIIQLLKDDKLYRRYRKNAINFASRFDWTDIFDAAFRETLKN